MTKTMLWIFSVSAIAVVLVLGISGCKEGPMGPQGAPGSSVLANLEGFAPGIQCATCHNPDTDTTYFIAGRELQWENSGHKGMGDYDENRSTCAGCHTSEGFIQRMNGLTVTDALDPTPVGCFACHSPHSRANFTLRTTSPVTLLSNIKGVANATFDDGEANLCAQCHQPRSVSTSTQIDISKQAATGTLVINTNRWYGHNALQALLLKGSNANGTGGGGGYEWPGYTYGNSTHSSLANAKTLACPDCHMADASPTATNAGRVGGHSMNIAFTDPSTGSTTYNFNACNTAINGSTCHKSAPLTTLDYKGKQTAVNDSMAVLYSILGAKGWIDTVSTSSTFGLVKLSNGSSGTLKIAPASRGGALWNYLFLAHDGSSGVHNSQYALDLLTASLAEIRKP